MTTPAELAIDFRVSGSLISAIMMGALGAPTAAATTSNRSRLRPAKAKVPENPQSRISWTTLCPVKPVETIKGVIGLYLGR